MEYNYNISFADEVSRRTTDCKAVLCGAIHGLGTVWPYTRVTTQRACACVHVPAILVLLFFSSFSFSFNFSYFHIASFIKEFYTQSSTHSTPLKHFFRERDLRKSIIGFIVSCCKKTANWRRPKSIFRAIWDWRSISDYCRPDHR